MNYSFHPAAKKDLQEAAKYYRERGGISLAQARYSLRSKIPWCYSCSIH